MKTKILTLLSIVPFLFACSHASGYSGITNKSYGKYGERNLYDVYFPLDVKSTSLVFYIHGGGWMAGNKGYAAKNDAIVYNDGYAYGALNYRYISENSSYEAIFEDITKCLTSIKKEASKRRITLNKVLFYGGSAGAHLSLLYAYKMKDVSPIEVGCVVSYSGVFDFTDPELYKNDNFNPIYEEWFSYLAGSPMKVNDIEASRDALMNISPVNYLDSACPTIIAHGDSDELFPLVLANTFNSKLEEKAIPHHMVVFNNSGHGLENDPDAMSQVEEYIKEYKALYLVKE